MFEWELNRNQLAWGLLGLLVVIVLSMVVLRLVGTLGFAVFLYYALRPANERFRDWFGDHPDVPPTLSLLLVGIPFLLIVGYTGLVTFREVCQIINSGQFQGLRTYVQPYVTDGSCIDFQAAAKAAIGVSPQGAQSQAAGLRGTVTKYASLAVTVLVRIFIVIVVAFYLLRNDEAISTWFTKSFDYDDAVVTFTKRVDDDLEHVFYGNLLTIVVTTIIAVVVYVGLDRLAPGGHVARPILLGLATGVAVIIPIVGMKIVWVPYSVWLLIQATGKGSTMPIWFPVVFAAVTFVVVDAIPDFWIRSYLSAGDLTLGMIMLAYVLGTVVFGWAGLFIGPIVLTVSYHFADAVFPKLVAGRSV